MTTPTHGFAQQLQDTASALFQHHLATYRPAEPPPGPDEPCYCLELPPQTIFQGFRDAFAAATDNHHPDQQRCEHPFGQAIEYLAEPILSAVAELDFQQDYAPQHPDPEAGVREFARLAFQDAIRKARAATSDRPPCAQCAALTTEQLLGQVYHGFGKSVDYPHGDDTVCDHPTHLMLRQFVHSIYLGINAARMNDPATDETAANPQL